MKSAFFFVALLLIPTILAARGKLDPKLATVKSIFVPGNNQSAEAIRHELEKTKRDCFTLATKAAEADAVLDIAQPMADSSSFGTLMGRTFVVSGILTLQSGDQVWSHSFREPDSGFTNGAKSATKELLSRLSSEKGCK